MSLKRAAFPRRSSRGSRASTTRPLQAGCSFRGARIAALGAMVLPFLGPIGAVTIFALLPLGIVSFVASRSGDWKIAFADVQAEGQEAVLTDAAFGAGDATA